MDGQAKIQLILEMRNRIKTGLTEARKNLNENVSAMKAQLNSFKSSWKENWKDMKQDLPMVGNAMRLLSNPLTAIAGGLALVGMKAREALQEAARFSSGWRELAMLNIDKPISDMRKLKSMILETSWDKGFDPTFATKAFFDIQSVTGKFGKEVNLIVSKQGEFANMMQADFNSWIAGTGKAMANYGFGAERLDEFNRAAFATVRTGVTTFDELSKVMSVYSGAASSAKQDFSAANKMFSIFTVKVKNVDEAATLTKSLFNDLTKETTITAFKKIGISMYDATGKFRQADDILLELNKKFMTLGGNDRAIMKLKNEFQGSEGLIAYIQAAMDASNQLKTTFDTFDATELGLNEAVRIANEDINLINKKLKNETLVLMTELGNTMTPIWNKTLRITNQVGNYIRDEFTFRRDRTEKNDDLKKRYGSYGETDAFALYPQLGDPTKLSDEEFNKLRRGVQNSMSSYRALADENDMGRRDWSKFFAPNRFKDYHYYSGSYNALNKMMKEAETARNSLIHPNTSDQFNPFAQTDLSTSDGKQTKTDDLSNKIINAAQPAKSITINIDAFNKGGINTQHTNLQQMDERQLEAWFKNMFMRVMANMETAGQ